MNQESAVTIKTNDSNLHVHGGLKSREDYSNHAKDNASLPAAEVMIIFYDSLVCLLACPGLGG